ncbi:unnamed protein product [Chrysoparadoxa australica]
MGLLTVGKPLSWDESAPHRNYVREHGVKQLINTYNRIKDSCCEELLWGDELEYGVFVVDHEAKTVKLSLRGGEMLAELSKKEQKAMHRCEGCTWHPEYGAWMVEATPRGPFSGYASDLLRVERNMRLRRKRIMGVLLPNEIAPSVTCFPLMGVGEFTSPSAPVCGPIANSEYIPDCVINPHPRFAALTRNIRARRGCNVDINMPLFQDTETPEFAAKLEDKALKQNGNGANGNAHLPPAPPSPDTPMVHMDAMAFGMGCCCCQVTFQGRDVDESRFMYDQLAVLSPIMLALTAATPIMKGRLLDTDVRWAVIAASVDDRTRAELGKLSTAEANAARDSNMAGDGVRRLYKSRYDSISTYLHYCKRRKDNPMHILDDYNDIPCVHSRRHSSLVSDTSVALYHPSALAFHVAHLFVRDPLVMFEGAVTEVDDNTATEHFESIQSTNWQTVRWKPPPPRSDPSDPQIGWRTEFRSMEIQITDAENAAFVVFVVLVTRVVLAFDLNLYVPLSKVDDNMQRAHRRDAVNTQKFFWRQHMAPPDDTEAASAAEDAQAPEPHAGHASTHDDEHDAGHGHQTGYEEMTIKEIMLGKEPYYPGLIPLVYAYLDHIRADSETINKVRQYLTLLERRARGELPTAASWIRSFVSRHPDYKNDSVVGQSIAYDLLMECKAIGEGAKRCPELLGDIRIRPVVPESGYDVPLESSRVGTNKMKALLAKYIGRDHWDESGRHAKDDRDREREDSNSSHFHSIRREPSNSFY